MKHHPTHGGASPAPHEERLPTRPRETTAPPSIHESRATKSHGKHLPIAALHSVPQSWRRRLEDTIRQSALIHTQTSLAASRRSAIAFRPRGIFVGLGLCSGPRVSQALPLDAVGYLLTAETIRRSLKAPKLMVLIADTHATTSGADPAAVATRAREVIAVVKRLRQRGGFRELELFSASSIHETMAYKGIFKTVKQRSSMFHHPYFTREAADIEYIRRRCGSLVKVGWTLGSKDARRDERAFDGLYENWVGHRVTFVYTKPGRVLDDAHPRGVPYTETDPARRVCLLPDEDLQKKLNPESGPASRDTTKAARNHLKAVCRLYSQMVEPLRGTLEERVHRVLDSLV